MPPDSGVRDSRKALFGELVEMLERLEWSAIDHHDHERCPECLGHKVSHDDDCRLADLLKRAKNCAT